MACVLYRYCLSLYTGWGPVDRNFCHVDLVNKNFVPVNRPNWHFEMACMLLMLRACSAKSTRSRRARTRKLLTSCSSSSEHRCACVHAGFGLGCPFGCATFRSRPAKQANPAWAAKLAENDSKNDKLRTYHRRGTRPSSLTPHSSALSPQ